MIEVQVNKESKYVPLFQILSNDLPKVDTVLISGGRDSGKSFAFSTFSIIAARDYNHRILYTRQTMASTSNSITKALVERMESLQIDGSFKLANDEFTANKGKGLITITGQQTSSGTQTAKLKSLENYSIFATDEGSEMTSYDDWVKIKRSIRAKDVQCLSVIIFNPESKAHWLHENFYKNIPDGFNGIVDNVLYIHTNYLDNGKENMALHNWIEYEELRNVYEYYLSVPISDRANLSKKIIKQYKTYKYAILGHFSPVAEGVIFEENVSFEIYPEDDDENLIESFGLDFGYSDFMAMVKTKVDFKNKKIYVKQILHKKKLTNSILVQNLKTLKINEEIEMWCDSSDPMSWNYLRENDYNAMPVNKKVFTVLQMLKLMLEYDIILDPDSPDLVECFGNYSWSKTRIDEPNHKYSDIVDATRYSFIMTYFQNTYGT